MSALTIEVPEWAEDRHLYVFAGVELLAYKLLDQPLHVKVSRCNMCGDCCIIRGEPCEHLIPDGKNKRTCGFGTGRPFSCSVGRGAERVDVCSEQFEVVE